MGFTCYEILDGPYLFFEGSDWSELILLSSFSLAVLLLRWRRHESI